MSFFLFCHCRSPPSSTHTGHKRINYDFAGKLWSSARNEDRVAFALRLKSHVVPNNRAESLRNIREKSWRHSAAFFCFFLFFSPFFNNATQRIQCTRQVRRRMPLHAHQLFLLTPVSTFVKIQTSLSKDIIAFFDQTKPMAGSQRWRHSFARQFNAKRIVIVWVFFLESHLDRILRWLPFPSRW